MRATYYLPKLQVIEQRAVSLFNSRGTHLGQALDSGGSDHIAGQWDVGVASDWSPLREPIPVTTANGSIYATWECTVPTLLGPMRCYYLENGGPPQSPLSVDELCREGEYIPMYTISGALILLTLKVTLKTSFQMGAFTLCLR